MVNVEGNIYKKLLEELELGNKAVMITVMDDKECGEKNCNRKILYTEDNIANSCISDLNKVVYEKAKQSLETGNLEFVQVNETESYLIEPYFPEPRLIVFGGGHIAKPLVEFGARAGFLVTVIDDRPSFANTARFPGAEKVICESFDKCFDLINLNRSTFVVIVTRGHRHDMECLREVLKHDTAYVGMIGSKRRVKGAMEQLVNEGYSKKKLDKVNAPIGIEIGAVTPDEIAFSIIAQVIKYRRLADGKEEKKILSKVNWPEIDRDVLMELCEEDSLPKAIITIISTKGSVPRKAGAKMLVWSNGKVSGSIGGGCSEGEVIVKSRYLLRDREYEVHRVDMTAEVAEEEGMVCGGIMDVFLEPFWN
ncbi:XdhC/CoxI family protein [Clostridium magnum]|uniref:XdhC family protein n=1 Tax=Clostridium magnum TaxID=33954 RepID=UPI000834D092